LTITEPKPLMRPVENEPVPPVSTPAMVPPPAPPPPPQAGQDDQAGRAEQG
jgi:hypothetical protein